jgi:hypothetical protein
MKSNLKNGLAILGVVSLVFVDSIISSNIAANDAKPKDTQTVTQIPSMETKISGKKNPVWVPTLHWVVNAFERDILKGNTLKLEKDSKDLNEAQKAIGENDLQGDEYIAMAGRNTSEWLKKLNSEVKKRFPQEKDKDFGKSVDYVAYSLIVKNLKFEIPFPKFKKKMDWNGKKIDGWGINSKYGMIKEKVPMKKDSKSSDNVPISPLRQVDELWYNKDKNKEADFGIAFNLKDKHKDTKVYVFQYIDNKPTTIKEAWDLSAKREKTNKYKIPKMACVSSLSIPRLKFSSKKSWETMCGKIKGSNIAIATVAQNIDFNFDNKGAYMRSEAMMCGGTAQETPLKLDVEKPFFVFMAKAGAKEPYFGMYVNDIK